MLDFKNTRLGFDRRITDYSKVRWLITRLLKNNRLLHPTVRPGSYINLGCGPNIHKDFVNIDAWWLPGLDICCDITRGLPIADQVADGIYSEHCLEHLTSADGRALLTECRRILAPKSVIRIAVPDIEHYSRLYVIALDAMATASPAQSTDHKAKVRRINDQINTLFYGSGHRVMYDFHAMADLLSDAGFSEIRRCSFRTGSDEKLLIDSEYRRIESLYVEAVSP
jgi:predicted SAM-dependent methyltransferase